MDFWVIFKTIRDEYGRVTKRTPVWVEMTKAAAYEALGNLHAPELCAVYSVEKKHYDQDIILKAIRDLFR